MLHLSEVNRADDRLAVDQGGKAFHHQIGDVLELVGPDDLKDRSRRSQHQSEYDGGDVAACEVQELTQHPFEVLWFLGGASASRAMSRAEAAATWRPAVRLCIRTSHQSSSFLPDKRTYATSHRSTLRCIRQR
jgi:hypothetical protein